MDRAVAALLPFVREWGLSLNPEDLHEIAYAVLTHGIDLAPDEATYEAITKAVEGQIEEHRQQQSRLYRDGGS